MEQQQEQKPEISPRAVFLARLIYWLLMLAWPVVTFTLHFYGGLLFFAAAQILYFHWMKKRGIFVVNNTNMARWRATWIYQYFYLPIIDESIEHGKRLKLYFMLSIAFIIFGILLLYLYFESTMYNIEDMVVIQGSYVGNQKLPQKNHCGDYLLTFRKDDVTQVQLWKFTDKKMILALEEGMKSNEKYTIWGEPQNYSLIPECRKFLSLAQIVGSKYKWMFRLNDSFMKKANIFAVCLLTLGIIMLWRIAAAGKILKNSKKLIRT